VVWDKTGGGITVLLPS